MSDVDNELCCLGLLEPNSFDQLHVCVYVLKSVRNIVPQHQSLSTISGFGKITCCICNIRFSSDVFVQIYPQPPFGMWSTTRNGSYIEVKYKKEYKT